MAENLSPDTTFTGEVMLPAGRVGDLPLRIGATNTGMYNGDDLALFFTLNGVNRLAINAGGLSLLSIGRVKWMAEPVDDGDATTKAYVDDEVDAMSFLLMGA